MRKKQAHYLNAGLSLEELAEKVFGINDPYGVQKAKDLLEKWENDFGISNNYGGLMNHHLRMREVANRLTRVLEGREPCNFSFDTETITKNSPSVDDDNVIVHYWDNEK